MDTNTSILSIKNIVKHFDISGGLLDQLSFQNGKVVRKKTTVKAVNDVSLEIKKGETLSVVGESGCGKSTLARVVMGLYPPNSGQVLYKGERIDQKIANDFPGPLCLAKSPEDRVADPGRTPAVS